MNKQILRSKVEVLPLEADSIVVVRLAAEVDAQVKQACPDFHGRLLVMPAGVDIQALSPEAMESLGWIRKWEPLPQPEMVPA
jgi:hypothetical protein